MAHPYIPLTEEDREELLNSVGVASVDELFGEIPAEHRDPAFDLPGALSEPELLSHLEELAGR